MESTVQRTSLQLSSSMNSNRSMKYGGLVHRSLYKQTKDVLVDLINYVYTVSPRMELVHLVISFFRVMQLIGPALQPANILWTNDPTLDITTSVISIFFHLLPPETRDSGCFYFNIVYVVINVLVAILLLASAHYFSKFAKIPTAIAYFIAFYLATFNYIYHPIAIDFAFEMLGKLVFFHTFNISELATSIVNILTIAVCLVYVWLYVIILAQTLTFRPTSFPALMPFVQILFFCGVLLSTCITGFSAKCTKIPTIVFLIFGTIVYIFIAMIPFYRGGFIQRTMNAFVCSASINGAIICCIFIVYTILDPFLTFTVLIIILALFVVLYVVVFFIMNRRCYRNILILDNFMESGDVMLFKSVNHFVNVVMDGMLVAHPVCIENWAVFKAAMDRWPSNGDVLFVFARFVSIYPEDNQTLAMLFHQVVSTKMKGMTCRTIKEQTMSITRQREANLSPNLKLKLNALQKRMQGTKHKLRHVWDLAIQGNIGEMEAGIKRAYTELDKNDSEFKHIFREFPNNRFVTRAYARFCKELTANHLEYTEYMEKSRLLQKGFLVSPDLTHELGMKAFPCLPNKVKAMADNQSMSLDTSMSSIEEGDDDTATEDATIITFREQIDELRIPAIKGTIYMRLGMLFGLFFAPMVALFVYSSIYISDLTAPLEYFKSIANLRQKISVVGTFGFRYFYEQIGVYNPVLAQGNKPTLFGGVWDTRNMLMNTLAIASQAVQEMADFNGYQSTNPNIVQSKNLMFGNTLNYSYFINPKTRADNYQTKIGRAHV